MKQLCTAILLLASIIAQAQTFNLPNAKDWTKTPHNFLWPDTTTLADGRRVVKTCTGIGASLPPVYFYKYDTLPALMRYSHQLDTQPVFRFVMYPITDKKTGVTKQWTIHHKLLIEVRELHNTREANRWFADCLNCNYQDYWVHITYLLPSIVAGKPLAYAPLPYTWKVINDDVFSVDQAPQMERVPEPPLTSSERGEERVDTFATYGGGMITPYFFKPGGARLFIDSSVGWTISRPDTTQVIRMVSDTRPSTWWRSVNHAPWPQIVYEITNLTGTMGYLNSKKKPFPKYLKVWPLR